MIFLNLIDDIILSMKKHGLLEMLKRLILHRKRLILLFGFFVFVFMIK